MLTGNISDKYTPGVRMKHVGDKRTPECVEDLRSIRTPGCVEVAGQQFATLSTHFHLVGLAVLLFKLLLRQWEQVCPAHGMSTCASSVVLPV